MIAEPRLDGRVVVVSVQEPAAALAAARAGAAVVVVGSAASEVGGIVDEVVRAGGRACAFVGSLEDDHDRDALSEMLAELFPDA